MNRAMALLAGLLLVSQVAAQPVAAAEGTSGPSRTPGGDRPDALTAGPIADLKTELVSGWWVGNERHSKFKLSNVGTGTAPDVRLWYQMISQDPIEPDTDNPSQKIELGDMPANAFQYFTVVCKPRPGYTCDKNRAKLLTDGSDSNPANNDAEDDV
jgi:hypothetical protein